MPLPQRSKSQKSDERIPTRPRVDRVKRNARATPGRRGVARNKTFKFRSSIFVAQRKSNNITEFYDLEQELNEGAYGVVYKARHNESGTERAVKKIEKSKWNTEENQKVIDEFNVLKKLDHPNILKMYELFEEDGHFYIVTDICKGGDLLDELEALEETGCFREEDAAVLVNQVLSSINYCHANNIVHRDLKPENVLLEQNKELNEIKLIDFGFAVPCDAKTRLEEQKGTAAYMSPQAMLEEPYGQKTDVWAVGVIAYIVLAGFNPFEGHTDQETAVLVEMGEFDFDIPEWENISDDAKDFVTKCLAYEEVDRPTAAEALAHPWIRNCRHSINTDFYKHGADACITALNNLQKFNAQSKLKQATYTFIASQLLLKEEKETIDKLFRSMDTDSDGKLGREEVKVGYKNIFGEDLSEEDVDNLFQQVDMNGDGIIEYSEFVVAAMQEEDLLTNANLKKAFTMFDYDDDGVISREDLRHVLNFFKTADNEESKESVEDHVIDKIMNQVDEGGKGKITFDDFKDIMFRTATIPLTQVPPDEEEEDLLLKEAKANASRMASDDSRSSAGSKINAKNSVKMPRRRSSKADALLAHMTAKDAKAKLEDFDREVIRTVSGSSDVSGLSADSLDDEPKNRNADDHATKRPIKKKITRTKSGFMTQRAEPIKDPKRAAAMAEAQHEPRRGRKKGAPAEGASKSASPGPRATPEQRAVPRTLTGGGATAPLLEKFRQLEKRKSVDAEKAADVLEGVKKMNEELYAEEEKRKSLEEEEATKTKEALAKLKKEKKEKKAMKSPKVEKDVRPKPATSPKQPPAPLSSPKKSTTPKAPASEKSPKARTEIRSSPATSSRPTSRDNVLPSDSKTKRKSFESKSLPPSAFATTPKSTANSKSPQRRPSPPPSDRIRHPSGTSTATSGSGVSSVSIDTATTGSSQVSSKAPSKLETSKRPSWKKPQPSPSSLDNTAGSNHSANTPKRPSWKKPQPSPESLDSANSGSAHTPSKLETSKRPSWKKPQPSADSLVSANSGSTHSSSRPSWKKPQRQPESANGEEKKNTDDEPREQKPRRGSLEDTPGNLPASGSVEKDEKNSNATSTTAPRRGSIKDKMNAFNGGTPRAGDTASLTAKRLEGLGENKGGVKAKQNLFKANGTFSFFPTNQARSPKSSPKSKVNRKMPLKAQSAAVQQTGVLDLDSSEEDSANHRSSEGAAPQNRNPVQKPVKTVTPAVAVSKPKPISARAKTTTGVPELSPNNLKKVRSQGSSNNDPNEESLSAGDFNKMMRSNSTGHNLNNQNGDKEDEEDDKMNASTGNSSLRNRMKVFEKNIQKNKQFGVNKKIF